MMKILIAFSLLFFNIFLQFVRCSDSSHSSEGGKKIKNKLSFSGKGTTVILVLGKDSSSYGDEGLEILLENAKLPLLSKKN